VKKKVAATRTIAAAETKISVVEFELAGGIGWDSGDVTLAAGAEGSAGGTLAACGGVVGTRCSGSILGGTSRGRTSRGRTSLG